MFSGEEIGRLLAPPHSTAAVDAFTRPLEGSSASATDGLVRRVIDEVEGYPYFIQLWGGELWDAARDAGVGVLNEELLDEIEHDIYRRLDSDFYEARVDAPTPPEHDLVLSTARCDYPPLRTADIRSRSPKTGANVNVLTGRLAVQGVVYRIQKGIYEYTAPNFHDYLQRRAERLAAEQP